MAEDLHRVTLSHLLRIFLSIVIVHGHYGTFYGICSVAFHAVFLVRHVAVTEGQRTGKRGGGKGDGNLKGQDTVQMWYLSREPLAMRETLGENR